MSNTLDLNILPVFRISGQDQTEMPGLFVAERPKRVPRGRSTDSLALYFTLTGNYPLPPGKQAQLLAGMAKIYYTTPGSVTAGLRAVVESLNESLLERNLNSASKGRQAVGMLTLIVLRGDQLYLSQSGATLAYLLQSSGPQELYDELGLGRGLGQSRNAPLRYFQASLQPGDTLLLATQPSSSWNKATLSGLHGQGPESMRRRLFQRTAIDLNAVLVQARPGKGAIELLRTAPSTGSAPAVEEVAPSAPLSAPSVPPPAPTSVPTPESPPPVSTPASQASPVIILPSPAAPPQAETEKTGRPTVTPPTGNGDESLEEMDEVIEVEGSALRALEHEAQRAGSAEPPLTAPESHKARDTRSRPVFSLAKIGRVFVAIGRPIAWLLLGISRFSQALASRLLPNDIPASTMAFIAVAVPVLVVSVASAVYFQLGQAAQYDLYYAEAAKMAETANLQSDLIARRTAWMDTLQAIERAEKYGRTAQTDMLRLQAQNALDDMDLIRRLSYKPAIVGGLHPDSRITRMLIAENDLYLLDSTSGSVFRALLTSQGYQLDLTFQCGPAGEGSPIGAIIGIAAWPAGMEPAAVLVGADATGSIIYCAPGQTPKVEQLSPPPSLRLEKLAGIAINQGDLYVLDPTGNAVWIYWNGRSKEVPQFYFGEVVPPMQDVVDLVVNNDELYLLHVDGHMTICYYSGLGVAPTRCTDNAPYIDLRPGRENTTFVPQEPFTEIVFHPPPDPSLYLMEPTTQSIYHFSLRNLAFQRQFTPEFNITGGDATAFTVNQIERKFYLAVGSGVYYATMP